MPRMIKEEVSKGSGGDISVTAVGLEQVTDSVPPDQITADETVPDAITGDSHDIHNTDSIAAEDDLEDAIEETALKRMKTSHQEGPYGMIETVVVVEGIQDPSEMTTQPDQDIDTLDWQTCSLCGQKVSDLAAHIVDDHTELQDAERASGAIKKHAPRPVRYKGPFRQVKPVLRFPCDGCKTVAKTSEALKKHMILAHNGHRNTAWMFCGDCEYATMSEDELINHVKIHQIFNILKEDFGPELARNQAKKDNAAYSESLLECGDCSYTTHYENQMFDHVKVHMAKTDQFGPVNEQERKKLQKLESREAFVILEGTFLNCSTCAFRSTERKEMAQHQKKVHNMDVDDEGKRLINIRQSAYHCTLCPFQGKTKAELQDHKMFTIHTKDGGTVTIKHNPLKRKPIPGLYMD